MAQEKPSYEVNDEFNGMAVQLVERYAEKFNGIEVDKVCCVNTSKTRKDNGTQWVRVSPWRPTHWTPPSLHVSDLLEWNRTLYSIK